MYYTPEAREKINAHLKRIKKKRLLYFGRKRELMDALISVIDNNVKGVYTQDISGLQQLINSDSGTYLSDVLNVLLGKKMASLFCKVRERSVLYPFSGGMHRRSFRSVKDNSLYFDNNIYLLQDAVYKSALGEFDIKHELKRKKELYEYDTLLPHILAIYIDDNDKEIIELLKNANETKKRIVIETLKL